MLSFFLEKALRKYCQLHPELSEKLYQKSILIHLSPLNKYWKIIFIGNNDVSCYTLSFEEAESHSVDLKISATPQSLIALLSRGDKTGLKLEGDAILAQVLDHCFNEVLDEKSIEKLFQSYLGDFGFYPVKTLIKKSQKCFKDWQVQTKNTVSDYLQEDNNYLPIPSEVHAFCHEVDELRLRVDRLEARLFSGNHHEKN